MSGVAFPAAQHLIDGDWKSARDGGELSVVDPATREVFTSVARAAADDVADAVAAGRRAQPAWAAMNASDRGALLHRWADLVIANVEELAAVEARDVGKPLSGGRMN